MLVSKLELPDDEKPKVCIFMNVQAAYKDYLISYKAAVQELDGFNNAEESKLSLSEFSKELKNKNNEYEVVLPLGMDGVVFYQGQNGVY